MNGTRTSRRRRGGIASLAALTSSALLAGVTVAAPTHAQEGAPDEEPGRAAVEQQLRDELADDGTTDFWVYLRDEADLAPASVVADRGEQGVFVYERLTAVAEASQAGLRAMLDAEGVDYESFWIANTVKVTGDEELLERIAALPEVEQITADRVYEIPEPIPAQEQQQVESVEWGIDRINAPHVWDEFGTTGEGIVVGTIDSGVLFTHPALVNQYRGHLGDGEFDHNYQWHDPSRVCGDPSRAPCDNSGHGTHVTGTMVGDDGGDNRIGVAPDAQWIAAKGCESRSCSQAALLSSGQFMLAPTDLNGNNPRPDLRPHVVNNSWGGGATTDAWYQPTVEAWVAAGIFPQFANGNWNNPGTAPCATASNPGNLAESYAAGAFDINDEIASFSHRGPSAWDSDLVKPNVAAPGVSVRSAWINGSYNTISGTSMASPHVAGTVALIWSAAIGIERNVEVTRELLDQTAVDVENLTCGGTAENNNVWGQGKLDAYAAVEASPRGPVGTLTGAVTDAQTDAPVVGATVEVVGEFERTETTGPDGRYSIRLPAGEYEVTAAAFAYDARTVDATVVGDETTTVDFPLAMVDTVTVSGHVTDGWDHGWPLHARIDVQDTPVSAYTDPLTGHYSLRLPADDTYTLLFESEYPGYESTTATVDAAGGDATVDRALEVGQCNAAPGYEFSGDIGVLDSTSNPRLAPYLEEQGIPVDRLGWNDDPTPYDLLIVNRPGFATGQPLLDVLDATDASGTSILFLDSQSNGTGIWLLNNMLGNPSSRTNGFGSSIPYLFYEVVEEHPILDGFEVGEEIVFDETSNRKDFAWFDGYEGEGRQVIAHAGRGDTGAMGPGIGVQERENNRHVLLSMHADAGFSTTERWTEDGEQLFFNAMEWLVPDAEFECVATDGGLVLGQVTDLNTGSGVNHASVASADVAGESATSFAPTDPALDDGFYWLFSAAGSQEFSAAADRYVELSHTVDVAPSAVTEVDFALPAGRLSVDADVVAAELELGRSEQQTVTVANTGTAPAQVAFDELAESFEVLGAEPTPGLGGEIQYVEGEFSPAARPSGDVGTGTQAQLPEAVRPSAAPWTDLPNYPVNVMDNAAAELDGKLYSFGGYNGTTGLANTYVYNPGSGVWQEAASMPAQRQKPEAVAVDGLIYVVGGWDGEFGATATTFIYDPESNSWSQGADMPDGRAAPGATVLDGQLYVVGGCTTSSCTPMADDVFRYDPGADEWETLANYPRPAAWLGCAGLSGEVLCVGGHNGEGATSAMSAYDPETDSWSERASLPYTNWAMGYAAANGQFVVTGGISGSFATNRSAAYSVSQGIWVDIEPANVPVYRGAAACGLYRIGGSLIDINPVAHGERHPDYDDCAHEVEVAWLDTDPQATTLSPGQSIAVTVSLDSGEVDQPGAHAAGLGVGHDTPYVVGPIAVTMEVTPPNNWGKITGTVRGADCFGGMVPLNRAVVQLEGRGTGAVVLRTGPDGSYTYWLPSGPVQLLVTAGGYLPESERSRARPKEETVTNVTLQAICGV